VYPVLYSYYCYFLFGVENSWVIVSDSCCHILISEIHRCFKCVKFVTVFLYLKNEYSITLYRCLMARCSTRRLVKLVLVVRMFAELWYQLRANPAAVVYQPRASFWRPPLRWRGRSNQPVSSAGLHRRWLKIYLLYLLSIRDLRDLYRYFILRPKCITKIFKE